MLEENNSLASESASKENEDGTRLQRFSVLGGLDGLASLRRVLVTVQRTDRSALSGARIVHTYLLWLLLVICWVKSRSLL